MLSLFLFNISACEICNNLKSNNHSVLRPQYRQLKEKVIKRINNNEQTFSNIESKNSIQLIFCLDFKIEKRLCKELKILYPELDEIIRHNVIKQTIKSDLSEFFKEDSILQSDNNKKIIGITALSTTVLILTTIKGKNIIQKCVKWKQPSIKTLIKNFKEVNTYKEQLKKLSKNKKMSYHNGYNESFKKSQEWNQLIEKFNTTIKKTIEASEEFKILEYQICTAYIKTLDKCIKKRNLTKKALINTLTNNLNKKVAKTIVKDFLQAFINNLDLIS